MEVEGGDGTGELVGGGGTWAGGLGPAVTSTAQGEAYLTAHGVAFDHISLLSKGHNSQADVYLVSARPDSLAGLGVSEAAAARALTVGDGGRRAAIFAIKLARPHDRTRLAREARILHRLSSGRDRITRIPDVLSEYTDAPALDALAMTLIPGVSLDDCFMPDSTTQLTISDSDHVLLAVAMWENLAALHAIQVAHRDYRLTNMMALPAGNGHDWRAIVTLDFGMAFHPDIPLLDERGNRRGSSGHDQPWWVVPQREADPDKRTFATESAIDIYMWAVDVYLAKYHQPPFHEGPEARWKHTTDPAEAAALLEGVLMPGMPAPLADAIRIGLSHAPGDRDPAAITELLAPLAGGLPALEHRASLDARVTRAKARLTAISSERKALQDELEQRRAEIDHLIERLREAEARLAAEAADVAGSEELAEQVQVLTDKLNAARREAREAKALLAEEERGWGERRDLYTAQMHAASARVGELEHEVAGLKDGTAAQQARVDALGARARKAEEERARLEDEVRQRSEAVTAAKAAEQQLRAETDRLKAELVKAKGEAAAAEQARTVAVKRASDAEQQLRAETSRLGNELTQVRGQVGASRSSGPKTAEIAFGVAAVVGLISLMAGILLGWAVEHDRGRDDGGASEGRAEPIVTGSGLVLQSHLVDRSRRPDAEDATSLGREISQGWRAGNYTASPFTGIADDGAFREQLKGVGHCKDGSGAVSRPAIALEFPDKALITGASRPGGGVRVMRRDEDGKEEWSRAITPAACRSITVAGGLVLVAGAPDQGQLVAFDVDTGDTVWWLSAASGEGGDPVALLVSDIADGSVFIRGTTFVARLDLATGRLLWARDSIDRAPTCDLASSGAIVFVQQCNGQVQRLALGTGSEAAKPLWVGTKGERVTVGPDGSVFVVAEQEVDGQRSTRISGLDATGVRRWDADTVVAGGFESMAAIPGNGLFVQTRTSDSSFVGYRVDRESGASSKLMSIDESEGIIGLDVLADVDGELAGIYQTKEGWYACVGMKIGTSYSGEEGNCTYVHTVPAGSKQIYSRGVGEFGDVLVTGTPDVATGVL